VHDRGDRRRSSFSSSSPLSSSTSLRRFLVLFADGDVISGSVEGAGCLGGDGARDGVRAFPLSGVEMAGTRVAPV
jgi:hypothetical protein